MGYLLDTHTLLWFLAGDEQLGSEAKKIIGDVGNDIFVSWASLWEIAIKVQLGKLRMASPFDVLFPSQLHDNAFDILPIRLEHLSQMLRLELHHRDPFDRLLLSQSIVEGLPLISKDRVFDSYPVEIIW